MYFVFCISYFVREGVQRPDVARVKNHMKWNKFSQFACKFVSAEGKFFVVRMFRCKVVLVGTTTVRGISRRGLKLFQIIIVHWIRILIPGFAAIACVYIYRCKYQ